VGALLEVRDLRVEYAGDRGIVPILNGISLDVQPGEALGVVGESGVGKTVLVRSVLGLLEPPWRATAGSVRYRERELLGQSERQ
jgi:ABC-type glutathione transport system ATPase component